MSLSLNARFVTCDGADCRARADIPIGLRSTLGDGAASTERIDGWLFAARGEERRHYCPRCLPLYLTSLYAFLSRDV